MQEDVTHNQEGKIAIRSRTRKDPDVGIRRQRIITLLKCSVEKMGKINERMGNFHRESETL